MSDTEGDDGGIDKEALREELREKYERDKRDREATERMSELLLKGATMTNRHCGTCADPLFQQNGTTFCPTCHGGPEGVEGRLDDGEDDAQLDTQTDAQRTASQRTDSPGTEANEPAGESADRASGVESGEEPGSNGDDGHSFDPVRSPAKPGGPTPPSPTGGVRRDVPSRDDHEVAGDFDAAYDSLVVALERFAREAAETDDPRYARECLEAAREAAEALSVLRR